MIVCEDLPPLCYQAGVGVVDITPPEPIWLAGWGARTQPSKGASHRIYVKTLALRSGDTTAAIVTADLLAYSDAMTRRVAQVASQQFGIKRDALMLCASHNHSAPVTEDVLPLYYELNQQQRDVIQRYTATLFQKMIESIDAAVSSFAPARLWFGQGLAGFAVNRRRARPGGRGLPGVVDHDVPVLAVRDAAGALRAVVGGYACHTTTVQDDTINGDYAGWFQTTLEERRPGATALFVAGCGADANPLPRFAPGLAESYGRTLAVAVEQVLDQPMTELNGPLRTSYGEAVLPLQTPPTRDELTAMLPQRTGMRRREVEHLLRRLDEDGRLPQSCVYPVQVWRFGDHLTWVSLTGEAVADYAIRIKQRYGFERTWVSAYANELLAYIPSRRVWEEGGYEGRTGMMECGHPAPFEPTIEELIVEQVDALWRSLQ